MPEHKCSRCYVAMKPYPFRIILEPVSNRRIAALLVRPYMCPNCGRVELFRSPEEEAPP